MSDQCVSCDEEVTSNNKAILCDLCESWEHMVCIRQSDRPTEALYDALVSCRSKAIVFICTKCRKRGSIVKRLMQHVYDCTRAEDEWLASARQLEENSRTVADLRKELRR